MNELPATVERYDPTTTEGTVLLDDGQRLHFTGDALAGTGLRLLRTGQRVRVQYVEATATRVQLITLP
jgi:cold shock CspA family protein